MDSKVLVSGIRSTGELHLGNYYGAMKGLIHLQEKYQSNFFIADLHSLTTNPKQEQMKTIILHLAKDYLAAGLDPNKSIFYTQSSLANEVSELSTYLGMVMPLGELLRTPTFKDKAKKHPNNVNYGLVGYPILMAADILIHKGEIVPVGEDQLVHLEITRSVVRRFNNLYGNYFTEPQPVIKNAVRIPALNGIGKMSKSEHVDTFISMGDSKSLIEQKVKKAFSDPTRIYKYQRGNATIDGCNIYHLHYFFTEREKLAQIKNKCENAEIGCVDCKKVLAENMNDIIEPFKEKRKNMSNEYIYEVLKKGGAKARESAQRTISEVRELIGLQVF